MKIDPPIWIYADFECIDMSVDDTHQETLQRNKTRGFSYNVLKNP